MSDRPSFAEQLDTYQSFLLDEIVPYWEPHVDLDGGGILNCIRDDGTLISDDAYMWSQLRALWVFAKLYNTVDNRSEWLAAAESIYRFVMVNGRDADGDWVYHTTRDGDIVEGAISIYSDGFALLALAEYYRATADPQVEKLGWYTARRALDKLSRPGSYGVAPYTIPEGMKCHGVSMIFSLAFWEFGRAIGEAQLVETGYQHTLAVMDRFLRPEHEALFEFVTLDNEIVDSPIGRCIVPGHAIESMWFQMHILGPRGDRERLDRAVESVRWHLERGWDRRYGGIYLGVDYRNVSPPYWEHADVKAWWPHTEALYALLLAYEVSGEQWCLDWYWRVYEWSFGHFPDRENGEWLQRLDRRGEPLQEYIALPVKDPFHLPRAVIYICQALRRLAAAERSGEARATH